MGIRISEEISTDTDAQQKAATLNLARYLDMDKVELISNVLAILRAQLYFRKTELGTRVRLHGSSLVRNEGTMRIGARTQMIGTLTPIELATGPEGLLEIGERCFINYGSSLSALAHVKIGNDCYLGNFVNILDNSYHRIEPERRLELPESRPVIVEDNVWIASKVTVLPGVTIGAGSAIGVGSVVTKDIPPRSLAVGTPARVIRQL